ncbi:MAG: hypothetical protein IJD88_02730 [Clostridia bacterium]|nr:hypothetical protein [Clostridia bacterium]
MINKSISSMEPLKKSRNGVDKKIKDLFYDVLVQLNNSARNNVWAKKTSFASMILKGVITVVLFLVVILWENVMKLVLELLKLLDEIVDISVSDILSFYNDTGSFLVLRLVFSALFIYAAYCFVREFFCNRLESAQKGIGGLENQIHKAIAKHDKDQIFNKKLDMISRGEDYEFSKDDALSRKFLRAVSSVEKVDKQMSLAKKITTITCAVALVLIVLFGMTSGFVPFIENGKTELTGMVASTLFLFALEIIVIIMLVVGEYTGKFTKAIGIALSALFSYGYYSIFEERLTSLFIEELEVEFLTTALGMSILMFAVSVAVILTTDLYLEKEKYDKGFKVNVSYGADKNGTKKTLFLHIPLHLIGVTILTTVLSSDASNTELYITIPIFGALWWLINCILRPRGSRLYGFWGRKRCIANEVVQMVMCFIAVIMETGYLPLESFFLILFVFLAAKAVGGIISYINFWVF